MSQVKLVWITPDADHVMGYCARVSNPANQDNPEVDKLLSYCARHGHWSVFEMASMCVEIHTTRAIAPQILRHRSFSFQEFCISGESLISCIDPSGRMSRRPIAELYKLQTDSRWSRMVRVYDERTKTLVPARVREVFKTGRKLVFNVTLGNGKSIKTTKEHKFLTPEGFLPLEQLRIGAVIGSNGVPCYQDRDWMAAAKQRSIEARTGVQGIANEAGISYYTVRSWLKKLGLQFTKQEVAAYTESWNKGLPTDQQPMFGKLHAETTRKKMQESSRKGQDSNLWQGGGDRRWRLQVADWQNKYRNLKLKEFNNQCASCGSLENLELDHIVAVSVAPEKAMDLTNLQVLCASCHKEKSRQEVQTIKWSPIVSIVEVGYEDTYDLEVEHVSHNYVANGICVHNSQRYQDVRALAEETKLPAWRAPHPKNRQASLDTLSQELKDRFDAMTEQYFELGKSLYEHLLEEGVAKEVAREVLPLATPTRLYMSGTVRSWIHYCQVRCGDGVQKEHRDLALAIRDLLLEQLPVLQEVLR